MKSARRDQVQRALKIMALLRGATQGMIEPFIFQIVQKFGSDPFLVLVSCLSSVRTRDTVSLPASLCLTAWGWCVLQSLPRQRKRSRSSCLANSGLSTIG